ncbi:UNVERIFIED_CONTAM: hypothetical protein GTU68_064079 [Idotea baltica]|nr:hypothetical protein [Idotea baltica]
MSSEKILLVEDDLELVGLLKRQLEQAGYQVDTENDGQAGLDLSLANDYSLVILDCDLPSLDGLTLCKQLRVAKPAIAILMLTGKTLEIEIVEGLQTGADDYVTKPFSLSELTARIEALLRRNKVAGSQETPSTNIQHGEIRIDASTRRVFLRDEEILVTKLEFDLLYLFATNPGRSFSRAELLETVWETKVDGYDSAVNSLVLRLRKKLERDVNKPIYIKAVRGVGYRFCELDELNA